MKQYQKIFVFLFFLLGYCITYGQDLFYNGFDQFTSNWQLINAAASDTTYQLHVRMSNKTQTGLFSGIKQYYIDVDYKIAPGKLNGVHFLGLQAITLQEGKFINRNRIYGRYSWLQYVSKDAFFAAGASLGLVNYAFQSSQGGAGGSDIAPDANIGVNYQIKNTRLGVAIQQLIPSTLQPIDQEVRLARFYNFTLSEVLNINPNTRVYMDVLYQKSTLSKSLISFSTHIELYKLYALGSIFKYERGVAFFAGLNDLVYSNIRFSTYFSYQLPLYTSSTSDNTFEIHLAVKL